MLHDDILSMEHNQGSHSFYLKFYACQEICYHLKGLLSMVYVSKPKFVVFVYGRWLQKATTIVTP